MSDRLLEVTDLKAGYEDQVIVDGVSFELAENEVLGIVGESGCGKSTLLKALINPKEYGVRIFDGQAVFQGRDLFRLSDRERKELYGKDISMVFQNSSSSFHPIRTYKKQFTETLKSHALWDRESSIKQIMKTLERVNLKDKERILESCPYELSGGMNQRVGIAMAILLNPKLFLADEPTSALDVTVQKQIVEELLELHRKMKNSMILITHNMGVAARMCDRIAVMYEGKIVECEQTQVLLKSPAHPYTKELLAAVPRLGRWQKLEERECQF